MIREPSGKVEFRLRDLPDVLTALATRPVIEDFSSTPGPDVDFCHDALMAVVTRLLAATGATAVLAEDIFMTRLFTQIGPDTLRIVHTHDVFSQKAANVVAVRYCRRSDQRRGGIAAAEPSRCRDGGDT